MIRILESRSYLHIVKSKTNKKFWFPMEVNNEEMDM